MKLSNKEKIEFRTPSPELKRDLRKIAQNRHNPVMVNGEVDMDRLLTFLNECNSFFNIKKKPFRRIIDKDMRL